MSKYKYDYAKRLKALVKRECKLERSEYLIAKETRKCENLITELHTSLLCYWEQQQTLQKRLEQAEKTNEQLKEFLAKETERLQLLKTSCAAKKEQQQQQQIEQNKVREQNLAQIDILHCLEDMSKVYVNYQELPARIKGLMLCDKLDGTKFHTIDMDPMQHTQQEVQDQIWQMTENDQILQAEWESLFFPTEETEGQAKNMHLSLVQID